MIMEDRQSNHHAIRPSSSSSSSNSSHTNLTTPKLNDIDDKSEISMETQLHNDPSTACPHTLIVALNVRSEQTERTASLHTSGQSTHTIESDGESTAGELDLPPCDSTTTTDPGSTAALIPAHCKLTNTSVQTKKVTISGPRLAPQQYENWSMIINVNDDYSKRGRLKRTKGSRVTVRLRDRAPQPLPRPSYIKVKSARAVPLVRKRRSSARARPQVSNATSEGDMAQADEMGEDGEGERDDGFVEGADSVRRRTKKRPTGLHALPSAISTASPPSSPSNTPIARRRSASRKSRTKPKTRKPPTRSTPTPASADISTQDTTTPGPCSSDTTEEEGTEGEGVAVSLTEDKHGPQSSLTSHQSKPLTNIATRSGNRSVSKPTLSRPNGLKSQPPQNGNGGKPAPPATRPIKRQPKTSVISSRGSQTSDAEHTSTSTLSGFTPNLVRRRFESDLSTAPLSSETSDMETSGNEKAEGSVSDRVPVHNPIPPRPLPPPKSKPAVVPGRGNVGVSSGDNKPKVVQPPSRPPVCRKPDSISTSATTKPTPPTPSASAAEKRVASTVAAHGDSSASSPEISQPYRRVQPVAPGPLDKTGKTVPPRTTGANIPSKPSKPPVPPKSKPETVNKVPPQQQQQQQQKCSKEAEKNKQSLKDKQPTPQGKSTQSQREQQLKQSSTSSSSQTRAASVTRSVKMGKSDSNGSLKDVPLKKTSSIGNLSGIQRRGSTPVTSRTPAVTLRPQRSYSAKTASHRLSTPNLSVDSSSLRGNGGSRSGSPSLKNGGRPPLSTAASKARYSVNLSNDNGKHTSIRSGGWKQPTATASTKPLKPTLPIKKPPPPVTKTTASAGKSTSSVTTSQAKPQLKNSTAAPTTAAKTAPVKTASVSAKTTPKPSTSSTSSTPTDSPLQQQRSIVVKLPTIKKIPPPRLLSSDRKSSSELESSGESHTPADTKITSPPPERPPRRRKTGEKKSVDVSDETKETSPLPEGAKSAKVFRRPPPEPPAKLRAPKSPGVSDTLVTSPPPPPACIQSPVSVRNPCPSHSSVVTSPPPHIKSPPCSPLPSSEGGSTLSKLLRRKPRNYEEYVPSSGQNPPDVGGYDLISWPLEREKTEEEIEQITGGRKLAHVESAPNMSLLKERPAVPSRHERTPSVQLSLPPRPPKTSLPGMVEDDDLDSSLPPPIPPRNFSVDELFDTSDSNLPSSQREASPRAGGRSLSTDDIPPPLPSQPIPKRKNVMASRPLSSTALSMSTVISPPLLKQKEQSHRPIQKSSSSSSSSSSEVERQPENVYEEIPGPAKKKQPEPAKKKQHHQYEMVEFLPRKPTPKKKQRSTSHDYETADTFRSPEPSTYSRISTSSAGSNDETDGSRERRFSASICVTSAYGLSPVALRRANSDHHQHRIPSVNITPIELQQNRTLKRTPSMDTLDDRMNQSVRVPVADWSGDEEEEKRVSSPHTVLPRPPTNTYQPPAVQENKQPGATKKKFDPEDEPLYQYLNHTEFSTIPREPSDMKTRTLPAKGSNQLEIARQLSINHRKLWSEQPEVIESGILKTITDQERKLQEAMFEVITSEASYLRSLTVLIEHFMEDAGMNPNLPEGRRVLDRRQHHVIFSNVKDVFQSSTKFLHELHQRQRESAIIQTICDIILKYAEDEFDCYITYCTNQVYQMRELTNLIENAIMFKEYVKRLESHRRCQNLNLQSFLLLPMQRITRMPLLILAILNRTPLDHPNHDLVEQTLRAVQKLVTACNDGARRMERTEELHSIYHKLDFGKIKPFPLVSVTRQLERKGTLLHLQVEQRLFVKPRIKQTPYYVFVFTDYVILTKKKKSQKGEDVYRVVDFASKAVVEVEVLELQEQGSLSRQVFGEQESLSRAMWVVSTSGEENAFLVTFLDNSAHKSERYILIAQNTTDRTRWLEAIKHPQNEKAKEDEKIYERWDCPQVQAVFDYQAQQPDELSLVRGDVVKVYRKMGDGWYEGERLRDLEWGWFPSNFTAEIENEHTRARNLKERHRLLTLPESQDPRFTTVQ